MTIRFLYWLPLALLTFLSLVTFWLSQSIQEAGGRVGINNDEPDSIIEDFSALSTDPEGKPKYRLVAAKLRHYSDSKRTQLDLPELTQLHAEQGKLKITSSTAEVGADGDKVEFMGDVNLLREQPGNLQAVSMKTSYLEVYPDRGVVSTNRPVLIRQPGLTVTANGLSLSSKTRVLKLTGRVKADYQNAHRV